MITVIVPVRNEAAGIKGVLLSLLRQDYPADAFEVIVVDGMSDDGTPAIVRRMLNDHRNLRLFDNPKRLSSAARNVGVVNSAGDYLVVVDGHCTIGDRRYLHNLERAFVESGADTLGRPQPLNVDHATAFQKCLARARQSKLGHNPDSAIFSDEAKFVEPQNVAVAYRRRVFDVVGLFDERFDACEDVEFNFRVHQAGMTCYFTPTIGVSYHPRSSLGGLVYQMIRYGRGRSRLAQKHPQSLTLPAVVPAAWLVWLAVAFAVGLFVPYVSTAFCASLVLYLAVVAAVSAALAFRGPPGSAVFLPLIFVGIHVGFGWGMLRETAAFFRRATRLQTRSASE